MAPTVGLTQWRRKRSCTRPRLNLMFGVVVGLVLIFQWIAILGHHRESRESNLTSTFQITPSMKDFVENQQELRPEHSHWRDHKEKLANRFQAGLQARSNHRPPVVSQRGVEKTPNATNSTSLQRITIESPLLTKSMANAHRAAFQRYVDHLNRTQHEHPVNITEIEALANATTPKRIPNKVIDFVKRSMPPPPVDFLNRQAMPRDVLGENFDLSTLQPLNYTLRSAYHGVLLDAGRHYFEIDWVKRMIQLLSIFQYNVIHFRLTDDQAWNVRLDSQPDLAYPATFHSNGRVYTPTQLRDLVSYAKQYNISIWPEIDVPGHGGAWAGIPGLVVPCSKFICEKGYGIPINVAHPRFRSILLDVLQEVIDIFDHPNYLHLGGDEVAMAEACFKELKIPPFDYDEFERELSSILQEVGYPPDKVIRWEVDEDRQTRPTVRAGEITQFWYKVPGFSTKRKGDYFASQGLYMDANGMDMAWKVFLQARRFYHITRGNYTFDAPLGLIAGTFELDTSFWHERNVVGRLLAVTMGASTEVVVDNGEELNSLYKDTCLRIGLDESLCSHYGYPLVEWLDYKMKWRLMWEKWTHGLCERVTTRTTSQRYLQPDYEIFLLPNGEKSEERPVPKNGVFLPDSLSGGQVAMEYAKTELGVNLTKTGDRWLSTMSQQVPGTRNASIFPSTNFSSALPGKPVAQGGIVMDLGIDPKVMNSLTKVLLPVLSRLGLNWIQMRLVDDLSFSYQSRVFPHLGYPGSQNTRESLSNLQAAVEQARSMGIGVVPEISVSSKAGGLYLLGMNVACPAYTYETKQGFQDIDDSDMIPIAYSLVREVWNLSSSGMIHLGSDERQAGQYCFREAGIDHPNWHGFEENLGELLQAAGIPNDKIIRWDNEEHIVHPDRLGNSTQCRMGDCPPTNPTSPWWATLDLSIGGAFDVYNSTRELAKQQPVVIMAELGARDQVSLLRNRVEARLLAMAMGLRSYAIGNQEEFETRFVPLCVEILDETTTNCIESAQSKESYTRRSLDWLEKGPERRVKQVHHYSFRPEFLGK